MFAIVLKHYLWDIAIGTMMDNIVANMRTTMPSVPFEIPNVGDNILLALKDESSDIVDVMMVGNSWLSVEVSDEDSPDYGNQYVVQFRDIDYIVNFGNSDDSPMMSDEELMAALREDWINAFQLPTKVKFIKGSFL